MFIMKERNDSKIMANFTWGEKGPKQLFYTCNLYTCIYIRGVIKKFVDCLCKIKTP